MSKYYGMMMSVAIDEEINLLEKHVPKKWKAYEKQEKLTRCKDYWRAKV